MSEYIEREALMKDCKRMIAEKRNSKTAPISWSHAYAEFLDNVERAPTVDAVPVTRCKNCRSYNKPKTGWCGVHLDREHPDDFCSYGERKDGGDDRV